MRRSRARRRSIAGFTLIEAMLATALMAAILSAIAMVTAQWLPNWNRGFGNVQRNELVALGVERLVADLATAEFIPASRENSLPVFEGAEAGVMFVRSALGPSARPGLEMVRIAETGSERGLTLVRTRAPLVPLAEGIAPRFADPVVLLRAPFRISFSYAGPDRVWRNTWRESPVLPKAIRLQVRDAATERVLSVSTATVVHAEIPADCISAEALADCLEGKRKQPAERANSAALPGAPPQRAR